MKGLKILIIMALMVAAFAVPQRMALANTEANATIECIVQEADAADVATEVQTPEPPVVNVVVQQSDSPLDFVKQNWIALIIGLFGFVEVLVRLTPSTKDDAAFKWVKEMFDFIIPNIKKGGGTHTSTT